jgi:hypothetical protein
MNSASGSAAILTTLIALFGVRLALGCYIIDCPLAGKRHDASADVPLIRQYADRQVGIHRLVRGWSRGGAAESQFDISFSGYVIML